MSPEALEALNNIRQTARIFDSMWPNMARQPEGPRISSLRGLPPLQLHQPQLLKEATWPLERRRELQPPPGGKTHTFDPWSAHGP